MKLAFTIGQLVLAGSTGLTLAFSVPKPLQKVAAVAGISAASVVAPPSSHAYEVIKLQADVPALVHIAKTNKDTILDLAKQSASAIHISKLPENKLEFLRDAGAGDVLLNLNGIPLDVSLISEKGAIDVELATEKGQLSFTISSEYLPKLPLFAKQYQYDGSPEQTVERLEAAVSTVPPTPFLEQISWFDVLEKGWTNMDVLGSVALTLGVAYGGSYAFYEESNAREEREAKEKMEQRKAAAAAKKTAAARDKKSEDGVPTKTVPKPVILDDKEYTEPVSNEYLAATTSRRKWYKPFAKSA